MTKDGMVDLTTGEDTGFSAPPVEDDKNQYFFGLDGIMLMTTFDYEGTDFEVMRLGLDGKDLWESPFETNSYSGAVAWGGTIYFAEANRIVAVSAADGEEKWHARAADEIFSVELLGNGSIVASCYADEYYDLTVFNTKGERIATVRDVGETVAVGEALIYVWRDSAVAAYATDSGDSGDQLWKLRFPEPRPTVLVAPGHHLYAVTEDGGVSGETASMVVSEVVAK
jgi:outer membrane protein assembly factor BamB